MPSSSFAARCPLLNGLPVLWPSLLTAGLAVLFAGCGRGGTPTYPVSGSVSALGKPVDAGDIIFIPVERAHGPNAGKITDGRYQLQAIAGEHRVEIRGLRPLPGAAKVLGEYPQENYLPPRYHSESTFKATVTPAGPNEFNFD